MELTQAILKLVTDKGYMVSVHRLPGEPPLLPPIYTEMHAVNPFGQQRAAHRSHG